jgi:dipeptidyl-peptidase III
LVPVIENGVITNIKVEYTGDYLGQMMEYGKKYSFLPIY